MTKTMRVPLRLVRKYEKVVNANALVGICDETAAEMAKAEADVQRAAVSFADEVLTLFRKRHRNT